MARKKKQSAQSIRQHKIHFYRQIAFTFIGAAIVVLIGLIYFSLSQALILVKPHLEQVKADFNILVKTETDNTDEGVSAQLHFTEVELERTGMAELQEEGEDQQATGTATVINTSNRAQPLVATTRLLSEEGVLFRIEDGVTVPPNGEVSVDVYADEAGKAGEIGPTRFTIPGLNQNRQQEVYAKSESAMTGGTKPIFTITRSSVDQLVESAEGRMLDLAKSQLEANGVATDGFLQNAVFFEILSEEIEPELGSNVEDFAVKLRARVAFIDADKQELLELAQAQLYSTTNIGYELSSSDEGSFTYDVSDFDPDNRQAQLHIVLEGQRRISSNHPALDTSNFVGEYPDDVKADLESDPGIDSVQIELRPFWLRKVPRLVDHIYVQFAS